jgi:small subunit ribosomal protein S7
VPVFSLCGRPDGGPGVEESGMPRRKVAEKREVLPDPVYGSKLVTKFVNSMTAKGKRSTGERLFYGSMRLIEERTKLDAQKLFKQAMDNVKPVVEVKSRRVGGATYQVPVEVRPDRRTSLALRWIIGFARKRTEKNMQERLAAELIEAANNRGASVKKREDTHKMAEANKAFAHYRW